MSSNFVFKLTDFFQDIDLVYRESTDAFALLAAQGGIDAPDIVWHVPDIGPKIPVRVNPRDRTFDITIDVLDSRVQQNLQRIKRMIDGSTSQAIRSYFTKSVRPVYLEVARPGQEHASTVHRVKFGVVNDAGSGTYSNAALVQEQARNVSIKLVLEPTGEPRRPLHLMNHHPSGKMTSPNFSSNRVHACSTGGGGTIDVAESSVIRLMSRSQEIVFDSSTDDQYVRFNLGELSSMTPDDNYTAFIWIHIPAWDGGHTAEQIDDLSLQWYDNSKGVMVDYVMDQSYPHDKYVDPRGTTWYKFQLEGQLGDATGSQWIRIIRKSASVTTAFYVGAVYTHIDPEPENEFSNPVCQNDTNSDGRADGFQAGSNVTYSMETTNWMTGGACQQLDYNGSGSYTETNNVTSKAGFARAHVWLRWETSETGGTISLRDTDGVIYESMTINAANSVATHVDSNQNDTWYRYDLFADNVRANWKVRVALPVGGTVYIDSIWQEDVDTDRKRRHGMPFHPLRSPDGFVSNSVDIFCSMLDDEVQEHQAQSAFVDFIMIPGDEAALIEQTITEIEFGASGDGGGFFVMARHTGDNDDIINDKYVHALDAANVTTTGSYTETDNADTDRVGDNYLEVGGHASGGTVYFDFTPDSDWWRTNRRVILIAGTETGMTPTMTIPTRYGSVNNAENGIGPALSGFDTPYLVDIGHLNVAETLTRWRLENTVTGAYQKYIRVVFGDSDALDAGDSLYLDAIYWVPQEEDGWLAVDAYSDQLTTLHVDGRFQEITHTNSEQRVGIIGGMWSIQPDLPSRIYYLRESTGDNGTWKHEHEVEYWIYPQFRHLYGRYYG